MKENNSIRMQNYCSIDERFKQLVQSGKYEVYLLSLMNSSKKIFPSQYEHNKNQSNSECDFIDIVSGDKYEAKLLISKEQGCLIGNRNSDIISWIKSMLIEIQEFNNCFTSNGLAGVHGLSLYKIIEQRLTCIEPDENVILFIPFPVVTDFEGSIFGQFAVDILQAIYDELKNHSVIGNRKVYTIYPAAQGKMVLRDMDTYHREYIPSPEIDKYVVYTTFPIPE